MEIWEKNGYVISTNKEDLDLDVIFNFLHNDAYWSKGIPKETVLKAIEHTPICFGVYKGEIGNKRRELAGFARVITDFATYAYLCDVFILPPYRKLGLGKWLIDSITHHHELQGVRRFMLATFDAHGLYKKYGFELIDHPEHFMHKIRQSPYK